MNSVRFEYLLHQIWFLWFALNSELNCWGAACVTWSLWWPAMSAGRDRQCTARDSLSAPTYHRLAWDRNTTSITCDVDEWVCFFFNFGFDLDLLIDQIWSSLHSSKDMNKSWLEQNLSKVFQTQLPKYFFWELLSNRVQLRLSVY